MNKKKLILFSMLEVIMVFSCNASDNTAFEQGQIQGRQRVQGGFWGNLFGGRGVGGDVPNNNRGLTGGTGEAFGRSLVEGAMGALSEGFDNEKVSNFIESNAGKLIDNLREKGLEEDIGNGIRLFTRPFTAELHDFVEEVTGTELARATDNIENSMNQFGGAIGNNIERVVIQTSNSTARFMVKNGIIFAIMAFLGTTGILGARAFWNYQEAIWINPLPKIIMESSDRAMMPFAKRIMYRAVSFFVSKKKSQKIDMVFSEDFKNKVKAFKFETQNIQQHIKAGNPNIQMSNKIFYGPPGTGKTMLAKQLAEESRLEWVYISAAALLQDKAGIEEIDKVFDWANNKKGVFIFFDEADALFKKREVGSDESKLVNHILAYLGTRNQNFMVVASTNILDSFDAAMERRFDDIIYFDLPGEKERHQALSMYRDTVLFDEHNGQVFVDFTKNYLTDEKIAYIAKKTEGSSYGHISGIINQILIKCLVVGKELNDDLIDQIIYDMTHKQTLFS